MNEPIIDRAEICFDGSAGSTVRVTCEPTPALLERIVSLGGRQELTIAAKLAPGARDPLHAAQAVLCGVLDGTVTPISADVAAQKPAPELVS